MNDLKNEWFEKWMIWKMNDLKFKDQAYFVTNSKFYSILLQSN